jgi:hypothetical protein
VGRRREIPPPPDGEPGIADARRLIGTGLWVAMQKLRARIARWIDPLDYESTSYREMALENAAEALGAEQDDGFAYPTPPEPGVDFELVDLPDDARDRMDAKMAEALVFVGRRKARAERRKRVRQRRLVAAAATGVLGLTAVGGASAVIGGETGIALIDRVLDLAEQDGDKSSIPPRPATPPAAGKAESYTSVVLQLPIQAGHGRSISTTAYESDAGSEICTVMATSDDARTGATSAVNCHVADSVDALLQKQPAYLTWTGFNGNGVVIGFAAPDVKKISALGPTGDLTVRLSRVWEPFTPGRKPLRLFLGITNEGVSPASPGTDELLDMGQYELTITRMDGSMVHLPRAQPPPLG